MQCHSWEKRVVGFSFIRGCKKEKETVALGKRGEGTLKRRGRVRGASLENFLFPGEVRRRTTRKLAPWEGSLHQPPGKKDERFQKATILPRLRGGKGINGKGYKGKKC